MDSNLKLGILVVFVGYFQQMVSRASKISLRLLVAPLKQFVWARCISVNHEKNVHETKYIHRLTLIA